ncbi:hypothetical protein PSHT_04865 [Puccinia striiformis]|uniref:Uncharacterized protein n=2 Tax=Puccinia striiformis TaxID=27350 RepID=A0A2S4WBV5_9BASI|nr:hypothetical protein PSHT_04865 [Puccinia striiformis]
MSPTYARSSIRMMLSSKSLYVCIFWHLLGADRLNGDAHAAEESVKALPAILHTDPRNGRVYAAVAEPSNKQQPGSSDDIPLGLAERKAQLVSLENDTSEIKNRIALLPANPLDCTLRWKAQLEEMFDALKKPVQDRVFNLNGYGVFTSIISNPDVKSGILKRPSPASLRPPAAQILSDKPQPATEGQDGTSRRGPWSSKSIGLSTSPPLIPGGKLRGPTITRSSTGERLLTAIPFQPSHAGSSPSSPSLDASRDISSDGTMEKLSSWEKDSTGMTSEDDDDSLFELDIARIFPEEHSPSTGPLVSNRHDKASPSSPTELQTNLGGRATRIGEIEVPSGVPRSELRGDPLVIIKEMIQDHLEGDRVWIWNALQTKLLEFEVWCSLWITTLSEDEAVFKLGFLQSVFLLGDYIHKHKLLSAKQIDNIDLFQLPAVMNTFFDKPESVIPQIEFLTTSPTLKHFHRTIEALPTHQHVYIVYAALHMITNLGPLHFASKESSSGFHRFCCVFRNPDLLTSALRITSTLKNAPETNYRDDREHTLIVTMIQDMIQFFQDPPRRKLSGQERLEFQMGFYMLDFVDKYYHPIFEAALLERPENRSILVRQLEYMRSYLKFFHNRSQDPVAHEFPKPDEPFLIIYNDRSSENANLRRWVKKVPMSLFHHRSRLYALRRKKTPDFNLMVSTLNRVLICIGVWHALGAAQVALSNVDRGAYTAEEALSTSPVIIRLDSFDGRVTSAADRSENQQTDQYDDFLREMAERKAQIETMENESTEINNRVQLLQAPTGEPSFAIKSELKEMIDVLKKPVRDEVFRLNGLGSTVTSLISEPDIKDLAHTSRDITRPSPHPLKPAAAQIPRGKSSPITDGQERRSGRSPLVFGDRNTAIARSSIVAAESHGPTIPRGSAHAAEHSPTTVTLQPSHAVTSSSSPRLDALRDIKLNGMVHKLSSLDKDLTRLESEGEDDSLLKLGTTQIFPARPLSTKRPLAYKYNHDESSTRSTREILPNLGGRETHHGEVEIPSHGAIRELHGDVLGVVMDHLENGRMRIWNSLEKKLLDFDSWSPRWRITLLKEEIIFKLEFAQSLFLLGDYIHNHMLLSANLIDKIELFKLPAVLNTMQTHIELLFHRWGRRFFDKPDSMIPQIDFLTTSPTTKHFHRTIKALPTQYHVYVVQVALHIITYLAPYYFKSKEASPAFFRLCHEFQRPQFRVTAQDLSLTLQNAPGTNFWDHRDQVRVVILIYDLVSFFQNPPRRRLSDQERLEFQMVFYILDFVDKYYQPIIEVTLPLRRHHLRAIFKKQLEYMRSYLKFFQNRSQDPSGYESTKEDEIFLTMYNDKSVENANLRRWIKEVPLKLFHHQSWLYRAGLRRLPNFDLWMGQRH